MEIMVIISVMLVIACLLNVKELKLKKHSDNKESDSFYTMPTSKLNLKKKTK